MTLTAREKILLFLLAVIAVLFVGIKFVIMPASQNSLKNTSALAELGMQQTIAQQKVAAANGADSKIKSQYGSAVSAASALLPQPDSDLLNNWLVSLIESSGLKTTNFSMAQAVSTDIGSGINGSTNSYLLSDYAKAYFKLTSSSVSGSSSGVSSGTSSGVKEGGLLCVTVTTDMNGTYAQSKTFLDKIKTCNKTVIVTNFTYAVNSGNSSIHAVLQCYGAQKLDGSDNTFAWTLPHPAGQKDLMQ